MKIDYTQAPRQYAYLGKIFRIARRGAGFTLRQASTVTGIRTVELSNIELGFRLPTLEEAELIEKAYKEPLKAMSI